MTLAVVVTLWILFQTGCKIYYNIFNPHKAVMYLRETTERPIVAIIGYTGWGFLMLTAFYFSGLYNF